MSTPRTRRWWEVGAGDGEWLEAEVLEDRTGGFNYGSGTSSSSSPTAARRRTSPGRGRTGLRCRLADRPRSGGEAIKGSAFTHPPEIYSITAAPIGGLVPASEASHETDELLGRATGRRARASSSATADAGAVGRREAGGPERHERRLGALGPRREASESGPETRTTRSTSRTASWSGARRSGPPTGAGSSTGRFLRKGPLRLSRYRYGGGRRGNVTSDTLTILRSAIPGVAAVTNPRPALGGVDSESLDAARLRAALEFRTRFRAVTADDFAFLAREATPRVARAACVPPENGGQVRLYILPRVDPPDRALVRGARPDRRPVRRGGRVPRRAPPDRHDRRAADEAARNERRGQPAGPAHRRRADRGGGRLRAVHLPEPVRGRLARGTRGRGGTSAGRSTRESCTGSSMPFRASTT